KRRKFNDRLYAIFEENRQNDNVSRDGLKETGSNRNSRAWQFANEQPFSLGSGLPHQAFSHAKLAVMSGTNVVRVGGQKDQLARIVALHLVNYALLRIHKRRQFGKEHSTHRWEVPLALQHTCKPSEVGLQPVLFGIAIGGQAEVVDHRVDVVF